jgi:Flp pilus assembly protein CpaB
MSLFETLRSRPGLNTALGVALAIVAGLMLLGFITKTTSADSGGRRVRIPVARADVPMGSVITGSMLEERQIPSDYVVPGSLREPSQITGARAVRFIGKGEPVTVSAIAGGEGAANLASRIPADLRAFSIDLSHNSRQAADLRPGDRVDVLSTGGDPPRATTILSGRLILSVGCVQGMDAEDAAASTAGALTLLVTPAEAELLAQAVSTTEISVSLCPSPPEGGRPETSRQDRKCDYAVTPAAFHAAARAFSRKS